jgi:hypothetical protein
VIIDVAPAPPGWIVTVSGVGIAEEFPLGSATVEAGGRELTVPWCDNADLDELGKRLVRIENRDIRAGDVRKYGRWLFGCLLEPVWPAIRTLPGVVAARGVELALRWPPDQAPLHQLTWEAVGDDGGPLAGDRDLLVAITRLVPDPTGSDDPARSDVHGTAACAGRRRCLRGEGRPERHP